MNPPYCTSPNHPDFERDYGRFQDDMEKEWKNYIEQEAEKYMAAREDEYFEHKDENSIITDYLIK